MVLTETIRSGTSSSVQEIEPSQEFGAFIQVFVKRGNTIGCLSYPLPAGITTDRAAMMLTTILYPDTPAESDSQYASSDGELLFLKRPGVHKDAVERFLKVPEVFLGVAQKDRWQEFMGEVGDNFWQSVGGARFESAQNSPGKLLYDFSYQVKNGRVIGLGVNGQEVQLSQLAMPGYEEHQKMLVALEQALLTEGEVTIINFDKSATVSACCAKFFKAKAGENPGMQLVLSDLAFYTGNFTFWTGEQKVCDKCGARLEGVCQCSNEG